MPWFRRKEAPLRPINWKTNLAVLWLSQLLSVAGFYFCLPFLPLYLKESNIVPEADVPYWAGIYFATAPISMMVASPIWGVLGDRYGRKMMLVRATLAGAFVLYLMGTVTNIEAIIVLRILQGVFTGTIHSAQTLVATATPEHKQGFALGLLMAGVNAGNTLGPYLGGLCADRYNAAATFKIGGFILLAACILVVIAVRENFSRPLPTPHTSRSARLRRRRESITNFMAGIPILAGITFISYMQTYDGPFLSLYVNELHQAAYGHADGVYTLTGTISGIAGLTSILGSVAVGIIMDRKLPPWTWVLLTVVCGLGAFCVYRDVSIFGLTLGRSTFLFFISGLASVLIVILSRMTHTSKRGTALGWSVTARSLGWALAPLSGAFFAQRFGFTAAYGVLTIGCALLIPFFIYLVRRYRSALYPEEEDPPSIDPVGESQFNTPGGQGRMG